MSIALARPTAMPCSSAMPSTEPRLAAKLNRPEDGRLGGTVTTQ